MLTEPQTKRVVAFFDGQNLFHAAKEAFGYRYLLLSIVRYVEFEQRVGDVRAPRGAKRQLVEAAIEAFDGDFGLADLERKCPGVSRDMVRRVLRDLRADGRVFCRGRGRAGRWEKRGNTLNRG